MQINGTDWKFRLIKKKIQKRKEKKRKKEREKENAVSWICRGQIILFVMSVLIADSL